MHEGSLCECDGVERDERTEANRLEDLWSGEFGDQYVDRNLEFGHRKAYWDEILSTHPCERVLEVGCNVGGNLRWIADRIGSEGTYGVDINSKALRQLHAELPDVNALWNRARELPFRDGWFDLTFTMGVLIHQPEATLIDVMSELVRTSRRWILCAEYHGETTEEVPYRGQEGALFRRDYGRLYLDNFDLDLVGRGFLGRDAGWDDLTWWLLQRG